MASKPCELIEAEPRDRVVEHRENRIAERQRQPDTPQVDAQPAEGDQDRFLADHGAAEGEAAPDPSAPGEGHAARRAQACYSAADESEPQALAGQPGQDYAFAVARQCHYR